MKKMPMITLESARNLIDEILSEKASFKVPRDLPPFHKVLMDGYAIRDEDLNSSEEKILKKVLTIPAGKRENEDFISKDECALVMTGGILPNGANRVIKREDIIKVDGDRITFPSRKHLDLVSPSSFIMPKGFELAEGELLQCKTLKKVHVAALGALASLGFSPKDISYRKVSLLATGDEIVSLDTPLSEMKKGEIWNANNVMIKSLLESYGVEVRDLGILKDDKEKILSTIRDEFEKEDRDCVIFSGGVSMGDFDFGPFVMKELGFTLLCDQVAIKPGKPFTLAKKGKKLIIGLPGNPVSALATSMVLLSRLFASDEFLTLPLGEVPHASCFDEKRRTFWPVRVIQGKVFPLSLSEYKGSGNIVSLLNADGFMEVDRAGLSPKDQVDVRFF